MTRRLSALNVAVLLSLVVLLSLFVLSAPAAAHDGDGVITVEQSEPISARTLRYTIRLTWANDGHPALDATVTATALAADGTAQTPVPLTPLDDDGRYTATLAFPGNEAWRVRFTAVTPTATVEQPAPIATTTSTVTTVTTAAPSTALSTTSVAPTTVVATTTSTGAVPSPPQESSGPSGRSVAAVIGIGVLAVAAASLIIARCRR